MGIGNCSVHFLFILVADIYEEGRILRTTSPFPIFFLFFLTLPDSNHWHSQSYRKVTPQGGFFSYLYPMASAAISTNFLNLKFIWTVLHKLIASYEYIIRVVLGW